MSSAADPVESLLCSTCQKIFNRPDFSVSECKSRDFYHISERIPLLLSELSASAQSGCDWCDAQLQQIRYWDEDLLRVHLVIGLQWSYNPENRRIFTNSRAFDLERYYICLQLDNGPKFLDVIILPSAAGVRHVITTPGDFPESTLSDASKALVVRWWEKCRADHEECRSGEKNWLPTRLIDVEEGPKLVATQTISKSPMPPYVALTHRWGTSFNKVFRLLSSNQEELMQAIPLNRLSQVFLDAILFTRRLGIRYIWIDSLCILQDSAEDWKTEAALMWKVYTLCALNIAADTATPSKEGISEKRTPSRVRTLSTYGRTFIRKEVSQEYFLTMQKNLTVDRFGPKSLQSRAWVLQERVLSPRTLHFSDQLFWECRRGMFSEALPEHLPRFEFRNPKGAFTARGQTAYVVWAELVRKYLSCDLTFSSDRFVALGAIAKIFEERVESLYCAGLWREEMPSCLIWSLQCKTPPARQTAYRCPTWSWLSLNFTDYINLYSEAQSVGVQLVMVDNVKIESPFGNHHTEISTAEIFLRGRLELFKPRSSKDFPCYVEDSVFDTGRDSVMDHDIYILPVLSYEGSVGFGTHISCLLLKNTEHDPQRFERVGCYRSARLEGLEKLEWAFELGETGADPDTLPDQIILI